MIGTHFSWSGTRPALPLNIEHPVLTTALEQQQNSMGSFGAALGNPYVQQAEATPAQFPETAPDEDRYVRKDVVQYVVMDDDGDIMSFHDTYLEAEDAADLGFGEQIVKLTGEGFVRA